MEVYYVIGLDDDWKPQHTMRIASREPITQDNISEAFKNAYAKVVIAQEVSGMGVAVESAKSDRKAALEALEVIELESYKPEHKQKSISDEIDIVRSFITKVTRRPITDGDINEALEWMADKRRFLENCTEGSPEYIAARKEDLRIVLFIERALTAQDVNAEQKGQPHE